MCGIFGIIVGQKSDLSLTSVRKNSDRLFRLSESRGKEASGVVIRAGIPDYRFKRTVCGFQTD